MNFHKFSTNRLQALTLLALLLVSTGVSSTEDNASIQIEAKSDPHATLVSIVERLRNLDADIGKLVVQNVSSSHVVLSAPSDDLFAVEGNNFEQDTDQSEAGHENEKFSSLLADLDSLQDEIGGLASNASRVRQYNIVARLRPLNSLIYRIRHNLHLMRNSLVAINTGESFLFVFVVY